MVLSFAPSFLTAFYALWLWALCAYCSVSPEVQLTRGGKGGGEEEGKDTSPFPSLLVSLSAFGLSIQVFPVLNRLHFFLLLFLMPNLYLVFSKGFSTMHRTVVIRW